MRIGPLRMRNWDGTPENESLGLDPWEWGFGIGPLRLENEDWAPENEHLRVDPWEWAFGIGPLRMSIGDWTPEIWEWALAMMKYEYTIMQWDFPVAMSRIFYLIEPESILGLFPGCSILAFRLSIRLKKHKSQNVPKIFIQKDNLQLTCKDSTEHVFSIWKYTLEVQLKHSVRLQQRVNQWPAARGVCYFQIVMSDSSQGWIFLSQGVYFSARGAYFFPEVYISSKL